MVDLDIIDTGFKSISDFGKDDLMPHFIYCGDHYDGGDNLNKMILTKMRKYKIQSSMLTMLIMQRRNLVTKEKVKNAAQGKLKNIGHGLWSLYTNYGNRSINDDLEGLLIDLQNHEVKKSKTVFSFFTPKLTKEELELVEKADEDHLKTYAKHYWGQNPDVDIDEMKKSDSKSKYVHGTCWRHTELLSLEQSP